MTNLEKLLIELQEAARLVNESYKERNQILDEYLNKQEEVIKEDK